MCRMVFFLFFVLMAAHMAFAEDARCADSAPPAPVEGLLLKKSKYSVRETINRLEKILKEKGITVALRWDHADKAKDVTIALRPTELLLFGNPALGSHMFTSNQTAGIDLPMKALAWEDEKGQVWLGYNDPSFLAKRHHIKDRQKIVDKMTSALNALSNAATGLSQP